MRNKSTILVLLIIFSLICFWNLGNTYLMFQMEDEYTLEQINNDPELKSKYDSYLNNSFTLGLDLQGGMFVTMEVGVEELVSKLAGDPEDPKFNTAIENASQRKISSQESFVDLFVEELTKLDQNVKLATYFASQENGISFTTSNAEVRDWLEEETNSAIERTYNIIRQRIDQFGVASPNLQLQEGTGRILIELPGVKDKDRVRKLLRNTAKLEFWETKTLVEAYPVIERIDAKLREINGVVLDTGATAVDTMAVDTNGTEQIEVVDADTDTMPDDTGITDIFDAGDTTTAGADSLTADEQYEKYKRENPFSALVVRVQGMDPESPVVGYTQIADTAKVDSILRMEEVQAVIPDDIRFLWSAKPVGEGETLMELIAIKYNREGVAKLEGDKITNARQDFDYQAGNQPIVSMDMNEEGRKIWANMTRSNEGKAIAIVLDNLVYSYPRVNEAILTGTSQISGGFTIEEAKDLANLLKAGKLPTQTKIQGEMEVGPTLGEAAINAGLQSFAIAFVIIILFMIFYYSRSGFIANIALIANLIFILGISASLGVVLTLPGIAAIVLTMGMAVDANVLIFERIREERALGKSLKAAIKEGYKNAFSSVMDANITTFLTGVILYAFGVGPIRGFAVNLMIGIVTSLISALFLTRLILDYYSNKGKETEHFFGTAFTKRVFENLRINMTGNRKTFYIVSLVLMLASAASIATQGFRTGVDFKGGRQYIVEFAQAPDLPQMRSALADRFGGETPVIKSLGEENQVMITTSYLVNDNEATEEVETALMDGLNGMGLDPQILQSTTVGPTVANDIKRSAIYSVIFSLIVIFLYILVRFRKWQYSLGALGSLFHDVVVVLGIFSILGTADFLPFSLEIDQAFIAAILTIIGYSINDTVIVFDRIRENLGLMKTSDLSTIYNTSISQTLSRTMITSLTTFLTVLILFLFGGDTIKGFMFGLLVGIIVGTYSSIYVASPIAHDLLLKESKTEQA